MSIEEKSDFNKIIQKAIGFTYRSDKKCFHICLNSVIMYIKRFS